VIGQLLLNTVLAGTSYALVAAGFSVIYVTARVFHFAHGAIYTVSAYVAYVSIMWLGLNPIIGVGIGILTGSLLGASMEMWVYRPLRRRDASFLVIFLTSLGLFISLQNLVSLFFGDAARVLSRSWGDGISIYGARATNFQIEEVIVSTLVVGVLWMGHRFSRYGRMLRAVADNPELSRIVGLPTGKIFLLSFILGSALASLGGILGGYDVALTPSMGFHALLVGMVAAIVGGLGSFAGALLGGLLVAFAENFGSAPFSSQWRDPIVFLILILFLFIRPEGLVGIRRLQVTT
jgi:branched-chain amino acid transport system permease protein